MSLKQKIEDNTTLSVLAILFAGFLAGLAAYKGLQEILERVHPTPTVEAPKQIPELPDNLIQTDPTPTPAIEAPKQIPEVTDNPTQTDPPTNGDFAVRVRRTAEQRSESLRELQNLMSQARLLAWTGIKDEYRSRLLGMKISKQAIAATQDVYNHYIEALNSIHQLHRHYIVRITEEYDSLLADNSTVPIESYQELLIKRPESLSQVESIIENLKSVDTDAANWNSKIPELIKRSISKTTGEAKRQAEP